MKRVYADVTKKSHQHKLFFGFVEVTPKIIILTYKLV